MAANALSGLTMNPNYHEFGPSSMENELAKIAAGGDRGLAFAMGIHANNVRQQDNQTYYDRLDKGDAARQGYAMQLGQQGQQSEMLKMITAALAKEGVPLGAALRVAQSVIGQQPMATPELEPSDAAALALKRGQALQAAGAGVNSFQEGGTKVPAGSLDGFLKSIIGGGGYDVAPTTVQAANVKATADSKPKLTFQSAGFGSGGKDSVQVSGEPGRMMTELGTNQDMRKLLPDLASKFSAGPAAAHAAPAAANPPPMAAGETVGPLSSASAAEAPASPAAADTAVRPEHYGAYQQVLSTAQQQGSQLGSVQPMGDGSLLIPEHQKSGTRSNIRIYKDANGNYKSRREPL